MPSDSQIETLKELRSVLKVRLERFLRIESRSEIRELFSKWQQEGWDAFLFGGILRDLMILGVDGEPRDIDVVVANRSSEQLRKSLSAHIVRETRFGGLHIWVASRHFDIWPLEQTWGLRHFRELPLAPEVLAKTTFLNVEAIVAGLPIEGQEPRVYEHGFLQALNTRVLDINLEQNPFPALAALRAILTAKRLNFRMSHRLKKYVLDVAEQLGIDALMAAQDSHYSEAMLSSLEIRKSLADLKGAHPA